MVAVLASMLLTATGLEAGINSDKIGDELPNGIDLQQVLQFGSPTADEASSYTVEARLSVNRTGSQSLELESTDVGFGASTLSMASGNLTSTSSVTLRNFSGEISLGPPLSASGTIEGWNTRSANFRGSMRLERVTGTGTFSVETQSPHRIALDSVKGILTANGTETKINEARNLEIEGFRGNISFNAQNSTMAIEGLATRLKSGSLKYS